MEWLDFGKYNFYVWTSYAIVFVVLALNIMLPVIQHRAFFKKLRRRRLARKNE